MASKSFDILVAKEFSVEMFDGSKELRTAWNKVGRAWRGKNPESIGFELFLFPGQKYVLQLSDRIQLRTPFENFEAVGGENE